MALERDLLSQGIRQLLFGLGRRATHRIVFAVDDDAVIVLRVRHASQDALSATKSADITPRPRPADFVDCNAPEN